jgi:hypothetical protein
MGRPFYAVIIPLGEGGHPDQGLPGGGYYPDQGLPGGEGGRPSHPIYHPGHPDHGLPAYPDQGLPGGGEGGGEYPDQGLPGRPPYVSNRPPGSRPPYPSTGPVRPGRPVDPGFGWGGGERPSHPIAPGGGGEHPDQGLPPELGPPVGPVHPWVPPSGEELPPPPQDIADQIVVAVWRPADQAWTVAVGEGPQPAPQ